VEKVEVKDLIVELLEFDLDAEVELYIDSAEEGGSFDFKIEASQRSVRKYLSLEVDLDNYVMVDKQDYENMKQKIENLEEDLGDAYQKLEGLQNE